MSDVIPGFDLYAELEVSERASPETIEAAWRSLIKRNHPDTGGAAAQARAVRLNAAHDWLAEPQRRRQYDAHLAEQRRRASKPPEPEPRPEAPPQPPEPEPTAGDGPTADPVAPSPAPGWERVVRVAARLLRFVNGVARFIALRSRQMASEARARLWIDTRRLAWVWGGALGLTGLLDVVSRFPGAMSLVAVAAVAVAPVWLSMLRGLRLTGSSALIGRAMQVLAAPVAVILVVVGMIDLASTELAQAPEPLGRGAVITIADMAVVLSLFAIRLRRSRPVMRRERLGGLFEITPPVWQRHRSRYARPIRLGDYLEMTPQEFEHAVGRVLARYGYQLDVVGGAGDMAVDLVGTDREGERVVVQCKRSAPGTAVGTPVLQRLIGMGMTSYGATRFVVVTTADFTADARALAATHGVSLISGRRLVEMASR